MKQLPHLTVITWPHPTLSKVAEPVSVFDQKLADFIQQMWECMYESQGIGLAAPQVNHSLQIFVMDCQNRAQDSKVLTCINPQIIEADEVVDSTEGCLSVPNIRVTVPRFNRILLKAQDVQGHSFEVHLTGLEAICAQHEIDHLQGKTFIDALSEPVKTQVLTQYAEYA